MKEKFFSVLSITLFVLSAIAFQTTINSPQPVEAAEVVYVAPPCKFTFSVDEVNANRAHWGNEYSSIPSPRDGRAIDLIANRGIALIGPVNKPASKTDKYMSCKDDVALASISGQVKSSTDRNGVTQLTITDPRTKISTKYLHMDLNDAATVKNGTKVTVGQEIGKISNKCGKNKCAKHIHFEVYSGKTNLTYKSISGRTNLANQWFFSNGLLSTDKTSFVFQNDTYGFGVEKNNVTAPTAAGDGLRYYVTGHDPYIVSPTFTNVDASKFKYLYVRYVNLNVTNRQRNLGKIFFKTDKDSQFSDSRFVEFGANTPYLTGDIIDMSSNPNWKGKITQIRIDIADNVNRNPNLREIKIEELSFLTNQNEFDFKNGLQGFVAENDLTNQTQQATGINFSISGGDPYFVSPKNYVQTSEYKYLVIKMKSDYIGKARAYFQSNLDSKFEDENSISFDVDSTDPKYYAFDLSEYPFHTSQLVQFRLDPIENRNPNVNGKNIRIDQIRFLNYRPADVAIKSSLSNAKVSKGQELTLNLEVKNSVDIAARLVKVAFNLPTGFYVPTLPTNCYKNQTEYNCDLYDMNGRQVRNIAIKVKSDSVVSGIKYDFTSTVNSEYTEINPSDNSSIATVEGIDIPVVQTKNVYRFWSNTQTEHFYTISEDEKNDLINNNAANWIYERVAFKAYDVRVPGSKPVYRFWSSTYKAHMFTIREDERQVLLNDRTNWVAEGIAFYAFDNQVANSKPVYRFYSDKFQAHFFTISEAERATTKQDPAWLDEGIGFYAFE